MNRSSPPCRPIEYCEDMPRNSDLTNCQSSCGLDLRSRKPLIGTPCFAWTPAAAGVSLRCTGSCGVTMGTRCPRFRCSVGRRGRGCYGLPGLLVAMMTRSVTTPFSVSTPVDGKDNTFQKRSQLSYENWKSIPTSST